ncbi:D-alanyl-D-alanine carboxypeptidase [Reichenbachiella agariperforans]|uniref:D-alanyl-D-alanine carboxypeptidase n=1 Tax=Reichenbachiella agariperforans TaxID=156994 RepID=A0A1M6WZ84_REIAG|nr:M15 family metallopeptidase [Reichenbachiella agariperforans]SHK98961.1 D-alanyl-D-alanine carboxypeptidase [Reichenbachiella agariperforans]
MTKVRAASSHQRGELPLELIEAFENEADMQWGGIWESTNVDYMHFEVRKQDIAKYLSQKKNQ